MKWCSLFKCTLKRSGKRTRNKCCEKCGMEECDTIALTMYKLGNAELNEVTDEETCSWPKWVLKKTMLVICVGRRMVTLTFINDTGQAQTLSVWRTRLSSPAWWDTAALVWAGLPPNSRGVRGASGQSGGCTQSVSPFSQVFCLFVFLTHFSLHSL